MRVLIYFHTVYSIFLVTQKRQSCRARPFRVTQLCTARVHKLVSSIADQAKPTAHRGCLFNYRSTTIFEDRSCGARTHPNRVPRIPRARGWTTPRTVLSSFSASRAAHFVSRLRSRPPRPIRSHVCLQCAPSSSRTGTRKECAPATARLASRLGGGPEREPGVVMYDI